MKNDRAIAILERLLQQYPNPTTELNHRNVYELVVAVVLSAQCTDKRVNEITPEFFKRFPTIEALSKATFEEVFDCIKRCSYPNNKAKHLIALAQKVMQEHGGEIPSDLEALMALPGVGRKSANVIRAVGFKIPCIPVDTHVQRVVNRLGIVQTKNPLQTEKALMELLPSSWYINAHHLFILHGRYTCKARKPLCHQCVVQQYCDYFKQSQQTK